MGQEVTQSALKFRVIKKLVGSRFVDIDFEELKSGDRFTAKDPTGEPEDGSTIYTATGDAYPCEPEGNWGIQIEH